MPGPISALVYMHLYCADVGPPGPVGAEGQKGLLLSTTQYGTMLNIQGKKVCTEECNNARITNFWLYNKGTEDIQDSEDIQEPWEEKG